MRKGHLDAGKPSTKWILTQSGQEMHARKLKLLALETKNALEMWIKLTAYPRRLGIGLGQFVYKLICLKTCQLFPTLLLQGVVTYKLHLAACRASCFEVS